MRDGHLGIGLLALKALTQEFHRGRKGQSEIQITFGHFEVETFHQKHKSNQHQEGECQNLERRLLLDELPNLICQGEHDTHRNDNGGNHYLNLIAEADGCQNGVKRKDHVNQNNLGNQPSPGFGALLFGGGLVGVISSELQVIDFGMQFGGRFGEEEKSASQ